MRRGALLVALLLATAPVLGVSTVPAGDVTRSTAAGPVVAPERNTSELLVLPPGTVAAERVGAATLDVGGTVAADAGALHARFGVEAIRAAYENASTTEARQAVLRTAADRVDARVDAVVRRERRARQRFVAGEITTREYLRELAVVASRARTLDEQVGLLSSLDGRTAGSPLSADRLSTMRGRLLPLYGPVRELIRGGMRGDVGAVRVAVVAGSDGFVLATVSPTSRQYVREAVVLTARDPTAPDRYQQPARTLSRVGELYPWTFNASQGLSIVSVLPDAGVYRIRLPYDHGTLEAYLDGGTDEVYYEVQRKTLSRLPTHGTMQTTEAGMVVTVNRTRAGGPLEVTVRDSLRREPVDARVAVDGVVVGRTGADGRLWTVTPPNRFQVTVRHGGDNASLSLSPTP